MSARDRARAALERYFERASYPRLIMTTVVLATGAAGFFSSAGLLRLGLTTMWVRYLAAFAVAYIVFLLLIRLWVEVERRRFQPEETDGRLDLECSPSNGEPDYSDLLDGHSFDLDLGDGWILGVIVLAGLALVLGSVAIVVSAPALLAEVFVDAVLMATLYKRMKNAALHHWLGTAIARTWMPMLIAACICAVAGACLQAVEPDAFTFGEAWKMMREEPATR